MKISVGIDPGKDGAITTIYEDGTVHTKVIPTIGSAGKRQVDVNELAAILYHLRDIMDNDNLVHVTIEDVHAKFGSAASATFSFGYVCGLIEGIVVGYNLPMTKVQPKTWQKEMWQGIPLMQKPSSTKKTMVTDTKAMSLLAVKRLFPAVPLQRSARAEKDHDGIVDALLLAEYGRRNFLK